MPPDHAADLATLIHDLRQPLSVIETSVFLLRTALDGDEDARIFENLDRIEQQVGEAHRLLMEAARAHSPMPAATKAESAGAA